MRLKRTLLCRPLGCSRERDEGGGSVRLQCLFFYYEGGDEEGYVCLDCGGETDASFNCTRKHNAFNKTL